MNMSIQNIPEICGGLRRVVIRESGVIHAGMATDYHQNPASHPTLDELVLINVMHQL